MDDGLWVGRDEVEGIPIESRKDVRPPPHWRLEAVAATERPRSLVLGPDRRRAVFIQDRETSDVWLLDLADPAPTRVTTGRDPMPYWEDTAPQLSPDGTRVAYAEEGAVKLAPAHGGPSVTLLAEAASPVWLDDASLVVSVEREEDASSRLAVADATDGWPRRLAATRGDHGDEWDAAVAPDGAEVAYVFTPRADLKRSEIRVADVATGAVRVLTGTAGMADRGPQWSPDGSTIAYVSERSGRWAVHLVGAGGNGERQLTTDEADWSELRWHPDGTRLVGVRGEENAFALASIDVATGAIEGLAPGGCWSAPDWTADGDVLAAFESPGTPPELRLVTPGGATRTLHAPAPLAVRRAPHIEPERVSFPSRDGLEIPAFLYRPVNTGAGTPAPVVVHPHGGPTAAHIEDWDGRLQYFLDKGYAWLQVNFRGSTGYGRDFERRNHGVWGVEDTWDCLAAADWLREQDWADGDRLAIAGGSYGSYMALLSVTDDPQHRYRCAVTEYGDCDIVTSWAQGDRGGVQDLERMMGRPSQAREAYLAGSAVHRLEQITVPLLIAHGERDERVHPKQSEELVAALRRLGGKTFEYVTYPTEAHGFLRAGPQVHFNKRLERFLDWYLM
jgi:dipeptidyl aminopeptidase/acylaminoacyl peptidase